MTHCHCSMCQKAHGAPFATYAEAPSKLFSWTAGEEAITIYESSPGFERAFCRYCGSVAPIMDNMSEGGQGDVFLPAGCLLEDPGVRAHTHIFADSHAPWHPIEDDLPQHIGYEHPEDGPTIDRPKPGQSCNGVLNGSCLCGEIAYEVRSPIMAVHNCHCSRCRRARAAAHTTNGFTEINGVVFTRGEDKLVTYKLPEARFFTQVFCPRCGSGMPRKDPEREIAIIPFGSLDVDPGRGADDHIFTASKAPWYEIPGDLPQFEGGPN
ncbi:MAG: GFA family protein [Pseudomonadota bacterium]